MAQRLFGVETEYGFAMIGSDGNPIERAQAAEHFDKVARNSGLTYLPGLGVRGIFLSCGRIYTDLGHPEFCTPECTDPREAVRYVLAGERILTGIVAGLHEEHPSIPEVLLFRTNCDYSGAETTWGCHESYLHRSDPAILPGQIIPHLVSRIIYTGAGGFHPTAAGLQFMLSPRVAHLIKETSGQSTNERPLFHTKDESLSSDGYHRLHLLCGESLCSQRASVLKVGTTALIVAMIDAGLRPGDAVPLPDPLEAMRAFSGDPECKTKALSRAWKGLTADAIQRHYLKLAEAHVHDDFMPSWAEDICRMWRLVLDELRRGPEAVSTTLDWAIKLALFKNHVRRSGSFTWDNLVHWSHIHRCMIHALQKVPATDRALTVEFVLGADSPIRDEVNRLSGYLEERGLKWAELRPFLNLRQELFELDVRFGQLGGLGLFEAMDQAGVLDHHVPDVDGIDQAMKNPPRTGRALARGRWIRRLARANRRCFCNWDFVLDLGKRRVLDLSDPLESRPRWHDLESAAIGNTSLADNLNFRMLMEVHTARRTHAGPQSAGAGFRSGERVVVAEGISIGPGVSTRPARITAVEQDEDGPLYRLDVDDGVIAWRAGDLRSWPPVAPAAGTSQGA